jgi:hypothetical protein
MHKADVSLLQISVLGTDAFSLIGRASRLMMISSTTSGSKLGIVTTYQLFSGS